MNAALVLDELVDCPDCDGQGIITVPLFGRHSPADCAERPCLSCDGTGVVDVDLIRGAR